MAGSETASAASPAPASSLADTFPVFAKIGVMSFGGPAAQISVMHRLLVDEKRWLSERQFLNALSFCMLLPGPEAMQLATYSGWRLHGLRGGLMAGLLFVLPGAAVMLALAWAYAAFGAMPVVSALFLGVKAAVLVVVIEALLRVSKKALDGRAHWLIAGAAFVGIFLLSLPYPLIVFLAAAYGFVFDARKADEVPHAGAVIRSRATLRTVAVWLAVWLVPLAAADWLFGSAILGAIGLFFSKLAVVTFGGAYAVLAYMAQAVVGDFGWLTPGEMMDGLGLAETTPGPLILVTEFVGFVAAFREGGVWLGLAGAAVTLWATFAPCFLWIFAGAPYIEWISAQPRLSGALSAITAAVVGVILNLSLWFGLHVMFAQVTQAQYGPLTLWLPDIATLNGSVAVLTAVCAVLMLRFGWGVGRVLILAAALGWGLETLV